MRITTTRTWVRRGNAIFSVDAPCIEAEFVNIVGKLGMNELAAFGSAALSENDQ